jgi:hypothetical protein
MSKILCSIHHFYYNGVECPLCLEERVREMENKFVKKETVKKEKQKEITDDMLSKLKSKFG